MYGSLGQKEFLDDYVIGEDHAKTALSIAVGNHYEHPVSASVITDEHGFGRANQNDPEIEIQKHFLQKR
jgi:ATP-dependent protease Clp ATPase subunit